MANPFFHSISSAKQFGGAWQDYIKVHAWFDASKGIVADARHRGLRHHDAGIDTAVAVFGALLTRSSDNETVAVRTIGEQHVEEDFGFIPTLDRWLGEMRDDFASIPGQRELRMRASRQAQLENLVKKFGGVETDYERYNDWFEEYASGDNRYGLLRHHAHGIFTLEEVFGPTFTRESDGKIIPTRYIGEQHTLRDFGRIPTAVEWLHTLPLQPWMSRGSRRLSEELEKAGLVSEGEPAYV